MLVWAICVQDPLRWHLAVALVWIPKELDNPGGRLNSKGVVEYRYFTHVMPRRHASIPAFCGAV